MINGKQLDKWKSENGPMIASEIIKAKKGRIDGIEEWVDGIIHESLKFEGHMGVSIIRPPIPANPEYIVIIRFDNYQNLAKWENSGIQRKWIEKGKDVIEDEPKVAKQTGLEFWFTPIFGNTAPALEAATWYKMAIVTGAVIFVILNTLLPLIQSVTAGLPDLLEALILVVIMILLMTYVIMPTITWLLRPWLSKKKLF